MAQPLQDRAPPFCLCLFGTTNRFKATDVQARIDFIKKVLNEHNIQAIGLSSDGDARLLKCMRSGIELGNKLDYDPQLPAGFNRFYFSKLNNDLCPTQDTLHILIKLRKPLIKVDSDLVLGHHAINVAFIINLIKSRPRGEHQLVLGDVYVQDKMNVGSVLKLIAPEVSELLKKWYGEETRALVLFLKSMRYLYEAFENKTESVRERFRKMTYTTMFMRIWKNKERSANFVTLNAYTCIEINFHMLINVYRKLRDWNMLKHFLPHKFSSQTCEEFFRTARSFTTTESTVINFTPLQFMHKVKRIQTLTDLNNYFQSQSHEVQDSCNIEVISDTDLLKIIEDGITEAVNDITQLGVQLDVEKCLKIGIKSTKINIKVEEEENSDDEQIIFDDRPNPITIEISSEEEDVEDEREDDDIIDECSGLLEPATNIVPPRGHYALKTSRGQDFYIKKGSFCYAYQKRDSVSTDRLYRFIPRHLGTYEQHTSDSDEDIHTNDWAIFKNFNCICHILKIRTGKKILNFINRHQMPPVSIYCTFFNVQRTAGHMIVKMAAVTPQYLPSSDFIGHIPTPNRSENGFIYFEPEHIRQVETLLQDT